MNFQALLDQIDAELRPAFGAEGQVASYIPALARVSPRQFGIALRTRDGEVAAAGDSGVAFSIQSVSKLFTLTLAMRLLGDKLWERIHREPSGNPFNSLLQLESEQGVPRNPFINAGAIAVADRLVSTLGDGAQAALLEMLGSLCGEAIAFDEEVAASEAATGYRNTALGNFMKSFGKLDNDVATVLDFYFHQCSLRMSCEQLAHATRLPVPRRRPPRRRRAGGERAAGAPPERVDAHLRHLRCRRRVRLPDRPAVQERRRRRHRRHRARPLEPVRLVARGRCERQLGARHARARAVREPHRAIHLLRSEAMDWFEGFEGGLHAAGEVELFARTGGNPAKPPLLLLHGYPQTHAMWQRVAQRLAADFSLVIPDLRGYGDSSKPGPAATPEADHALHSKRVMAADMAALMSGLGHARFAVVGHDRGARVAHRLALDHGERIERLALIDIVPTLDMYDMTEMRFATYYYHWFFLIQPQPLPERMIGGDPSFYLRWTLGGWGAKSLDHIEPEALAEYERCFGRADAIHAACEDYRASASIDLEHDRASREAGEKIACDTLVLWGEHGVVGKLYAPLVLWRAQCAGKLEGRAMSAGHFIPEELPDETARRLRDFLLAR